MICDEGRSAMSDDNDDEDERAVSDMTVGLVCSVLGFGVCSALYWGLVCWFDF